MSYENFSLRMPPFKIVAPSGSGDSRANLEEAEWSGKAAKSLGEDSDLPPVLWYRQAVELQNTDGIDDSFFIESHPEFGEARTLLRLPKAVILLNPIDEFNGSGDSYADMIDPVILQGMQERGIYFGTMNDDFGCFSAGIPYVGINSYDHLSEEILVKQINIDSFIGGEVLFVRLSADAVSPQNYCEFSEDGQVINQYTQYSECDDVILPDVDASDPSCSSL